MKGIIIKVVLFLAVSLFLKSESKNAEVDQMSNTNCDVCDIAKSCQEIKKKNPASPSGMYSILTNEFTTQLVYCDMGMLCGSAAGWTRLAYIDMTDSSAGCPTELALFMDQGVRACGRPRSGRGCNLVGNYSSNGLGYSEVCGRAIGYQYRSPDAVDSTIGKAAQNDINSYYVDGMSLTRGNPRKHIWTFMAGLKEDNSYARGRYTCPCQTGSQQASNMPYFIGNDYYCESGNPASPRGFAAKLYTADPLWDGQQCNGPESPCCSSPRLPWFYKKLDAPTDEYIEARVCTDEGTGNENVAIQLLEVFVK